MSVYKFGTLKSPPRRPTVQGSEQSPFCTSPSQLQEVKLDPGSTGIRTVSFASPGKSPPICGRTMKEYEDLLSQLQRENFNLKLRIYFLDERMGLMNRNRVDDKEDHSKENIELKVECESLRKDVSDKQELLCQAAKALDVLEEQHHSELKKLKEQHDIEKGILDSHIQELEKELKLFKESAKEQMFLNLKSTGALEETEYLKQQIADLTSQVVTMKLEQNYRNNSSKSSSTQTSTIEETSSPGRSTDLNSDVSLKDKQLRTMEELKKEDPLRHEGTQVQVNELESQLTESTTKLCKSEELLKNQECQVIHIDEERIKAYQAIKGFMKKNKDLACELEQLKLAMEERDHYIQDLTSELAELHHKCNKIDSEAYQLPAQAHIQDRHGKSGTFENVQDRTKEENERMSAEYEDKRKKLAKNTTQQDDISTEMANEVQNLRTALRDKILRLEECEKKYAASSSELETKNKHIEELNEKLIEVNKKLNVIEKNLQERSTAEKQDKKDSEEKQRQICNLEVELEDTKEVENLNKELWNKNKEIEHLRDGGKKKEMEIILLQQELNARYYQFHLIQEKVTELGVRVSLPTFHVFREMQQHQEDETYFAQQKAMAGDADHNLHDQLHASWDDRKYLCQKVEELREILRNTPEHGNDIRALKTECTRLQEELKGADCWCRNASEICFKLTQRLEELSVFLDALLQNPEQLNALSVQRRLSLRQAAKRNKEMSHSLSVALSTTNQDFNESILPFLKDSFSIISMASDLNISDLLNESSDVEMASVNEEKRSFEMHVEEDNNPENVSVSILNRPEPVNNLHLQVEAQQQEMEQNNKEKELPQIANKIPHASADSVQKSETGDNNSFSSMAFSTNKANVSYCGCGAVVCEDARPLGSSLSDSDVEQTYPFTTSYQGLREEILPRFLPPDHLEIVQLTRLMAKFQMLSLGTPSNLSVPKRNTKATGVTEMSCSASAAPLSHVVPVVPKKECVVGSLSDSEAWSEPDRSVSMARIGLSEEGANTVLLPDTNVNVGSKCCRKVNQMVDTSSDSSEETTHKIIGAAGKRGESMAAEIKRLQNKLRAMKHKNENLKAELNLMYQMTSIGNGSVLDCNQNMSAVSGVGVGNGANVLKSPSKNVNQIGSISLIETKESEHKVELQDRSTNTSPVMNKSNMESSTSTKVAQNAVRSLKEHVERLEALLKAQGIELADQKCLMCAWKENSLEMEHMLQAKHKLKEDYRKQLEEMMRLEKEKDVKVVAAERIQEDAKIKLAEMEIELRDCKILLENEKLEKVRALKFQENAEIKLTKMEIELNDYKILVEDEKWQKLEALKVQEDAKIKLAEIEIELSNYKVLVENHNLERVELQKEKEEIVKKFEIMLREVSAEKDEVEYQNSETRKEMQKVELQKLEAERMVIKMQEASEKFKDECKKHVEKVIEKHKRDLETQLQLEVSEEKQKLEDLYRKDVEAKKSDYEAKLKQMLKEIRKKAEDKIKTLEEEHKKIVIDLKKQIQEKEKCVHAREIELKKKLNEATLTNSKIALEKTRVVNEKLHLEKELHKQEAVKCDLILEKNEAENTLSTLKKRMVKKLTALHQLTKDKRQLARAVRDLQVTNDELLKRLCAPDAENLSTGNQGNTISGNESTPSKTLSSFSPGSFSSLLDGGSTGPVSLETNISLGDDQNVGLECLSTLPNLTLEKGIPRQQSDDMSEDQSREGYKAVFSEMRKAEVDGKSVWVTQQHTTTLSSNARTLISPDLGIESDQGRFSSLEASSSAPPEIPQTDADDTGTKDSKKLQKENFMLKQRLYRTNHALKQAVMQLSQANQRKKEVEEVIRKQLDKTNAILKDTRDNLEEKTEEAEEVMK